MYGQATRGHVALYFHIKIAEARAGTVTVTNIYNKNIKKLSATMHYLFIENIILKLCCQSLKSALQNKRKKYKYRKPLQFELAAPENGSA
jgi:hypothetical protein